jgi:hypothetical protein
MLTFLLAAAIASPSAPATPQVPTVADTAKRDHRTKKICRASVPLGSRLGGATVCRTAAEWAETKAEARRTVERVQGTSSSCLRGGGGPGGAPVC